VAEITLKNKKKILFIARHFITLYHFRREMIHEMLERGHEVYLSIPRCEECRIFEEMGCHIIDTQIDRRGVNPLHDLRLIFDYRKMMCRLMPDIIFSFNIKPNIYGSIASNSLGLRQVCNITGKGATFLRPSLVGVICKILYRVSVRRCYKVMFQNTEDRDFFISQRMVGEQYTVIPGSGCNIDYFQPAPIPVCGDIVFLMVARVMALKGIEEYIRCAEIIRNKYPNVRFRLAGSDEQPAYLRMVEVAVRRGIIEYVGYQKDIRPQLVQCHCCVLPSHGGEGVSNALLEAAATGRPCIGSDIAGISCIIEDGISGYLCKKGDAADLVSKVELFLSLDYGERAAMGLAGRDKVVRFFDRRFVTSVYLEEIDRIEKQKNDI